MPAVYVETREVPLDELSHFEGNAKRGDVEAIRASIRRNGQYRSLVVRRIDGGPLIVLAGNHTMRALGAEGYETARCEIVTCDDDEARRINLADNKLAELGAYDNDALAELLSYMDGDYEGTGYTDEDVMRLITPPDIDDLAGDDDGPAPEPEENPTLADRFLIPPFDVLDARQGWWRSRKKQWLSLGMRSEIGREGNLVFEGMAKADPKYYDKKRAVEQAIGRALTSAEFEADHYVRPDDAVASGTSVFDPVLCELAYRWFCPPGGTILDPFAGGSVRGIIAGILGRPYRGNDLRPEQVESNREQRDEFMQRRILTADPSWTIGDSSDWVKTLEANSADMVFTCPPYYDLEEYSDNPADLSSMSYDGFDEAYARIIAGVAKALKPNRYAVFITGDARDNRGALHDLRGSTIRAAVAAGLTYASGAVLVSPVGTAAVMAGRTFAGTRGLARTHQDFLVFCKGNRSEAAKACGDVDVHMPDGLEDAFTDVVEEEVPEAA
jgi:DNA modification methylase